MQLNFFPIKFDFESFQIGRTKYTDETLLEFRKKHNSTHSFFRDGHDIYISNNTSNSIELSLEDVTKNIFSDRKITSSLIKHIFFRTFKERFTTFIPVDFYPFRFFSSKDKDDLLYNILPSHLKGRIGYKKLIEVELRFSTINNIEQYGFVINIKRNWIFDKNCATLHLEGYNLTGIEVLHTEIFPGMGGILAPNEEFIGTVLQVNGDFAKVQTNEGDVEYPLNQLFIKKTRNNIATYLDFATPGKTADILRVIDDKRYELYDTKNLHKEICDIARVLFTGVLDKKSIQFENKDGFYFIVQEVPLEFTNTFELKTPTFIFDPAGTKTNNVSPDIGLTNFGPYDSINFDTKSPSVLCICHRENRGHYSNFLASLRDGITESRFFKKGLLKKYELQDLTFHINQLNSFNISEYLRIISEWKQDSKPDLAIIEIPDEFKKLKDDDNPYYKLKAKLLSLEIPVQYISTEKIKSYNEYILNSISLQIYAKLGGTPWVLPSNRSVDREIIIGIGHTLIRSNQFRGAEQSKIVGITTFLSSDGQYLLGDKVKDVLFENYFQELLSSLSQSFNRLEKEQGWSEGDTVRLIFHIFKPIKNTEFDVISQFIKNNTKYKIKFAFVTISKSHPHLIFDPTQPGISNKGAFIPNRATNVFLDSETCLVQMLGAKDLKTSKQGMSNPIQIKIRTPQGNYDNNELNALLYYDLAYIVQQVFSFTYLSWRSFLPAELPATMLYSNLISKLLSKMRNVPGWDADRLNYSLKRKKWFL